MTPRTMIARMLHTISLGRVTIVDDSGVIQKLQVSERPGADGSTTVTDGVLRIGQFGFASSPPVQSDVLLVRLWGNRTFSVALGLNHQQSRLKNLKAGDSALYDLRGAYVWLTPQGLLINGAGLPATICNVGKLTLQGDLYVTGDVIAQSTGDAVSLTKHLHPLQGPGSLETGAPLPE